MTPVAFPAASGVGVGKSGAADQSWWGQPDANSAWKSVKDVTQDAPGFVKTWFCHPEADLFVWTDAAGTLGALQFCFDKNTQEQMVAWDRGSPVTAGTVDSGETSPLHNRSPVLRQANLLTQQGPAVWARLHAGLPPALVREVEKRLGWDGATTPG